MYVDWNRKITAKYGMVDFDTEILKISFLKIYFYILVCFYAIFTDRSHGIGIILIVGRTHF